MTTAWADIEDLVMQADHSEFPYHGGFITKNEWVYARMKDEISRGVLAPGERIVVAAIARRYNVSAMPVRDALNRLSQDGFVHIAPHAGAKVVSIDVDQLGEIMVIRQELEPLAARLATNLLTEESIARLESLHARMEARAAENDRLAYEPLNWTFHDHIYASCGNRTLYDLVMSLWKRSCITRSVFVRLPNQLERSLEDHRAWLDALRARDPERVAGVVRSHLKQSLDRLHNQMKR